MQNASSSISPERRAAKNAAKRRYYARHRERLAAEKRQYRAENPGKEAAAKRRYYLNNAETVREKSRKYNQKNKKKRNAKNQELRKKNPDRTYKTWYAANLKYRYGITIDEYNAMFAAQGGCCAICLEPRTNSKGKLHVDHCHGTGKVRGLLCHHCNSVLGHARDNPDVLRNAISYLERD